MIENLIEKFKIAQSIAYDCSVYTEHHLKSGMSEKDACNIMTEYLYKRDVKDFFHLPFAWFGKRSGFKNFERPLSISNHLPHFGKEFLPTNKKLEEGMCVILDVAPIIDGVMVDIGHSFSFGTNVEVTKAKEDLLKLRDLILEGVKSNKLMSQIYTECDELIKDLNYENGHSLYPLGVLGHRVGSFEKKFPRISLRGFQLRAYSFLLKNQLDALLKKDKTAGIWNIESDFEVPEGLWAIEPHITTKEFGVKFEEILVVKRDDAYWLSDDLPHLKFS